MLSRWMLQSRIRLRSDVEKLGPLLWSSELLDLHLTRIIRRLGEDSMSGKLSLVAAKMAEKRKAWDGRAQKLLDGMETLDARANAAFDRHEVALSSAEAGFKEMEDSVRDLEGGNLPSLEGSGDSSFRSTDTKKEG